MILAAVHESCSSMRKAMDEDVLLISLWMDISPGTRPGGGLSAAHEKHEISGTYALLCSTPSCHLMPPSDRPTSAIPLFQLALAWMSSAVSWSSLVGPAVGDSELEHFVVFSVDRVLGVENEMR